MFCPFHLVFSAMLGTMYWEIVILTVLMEYYFLIKFLAWTHF